MKNLLLIIILFSFCLITCNKIDNNPTFRVNNSLVIKAGFMCGWGSGEDSLIITSTTIKYVYSVPAKSQIPEINEVRQTTTAEWNNILNSINFNDFLNLNYNTCHICVDGCDEWISVKNDEIYHQIRFGMGSEIDSIKPLQDILTQLRSEFRK
jgi:hypothetical protein